MKELISFLLANIVTQPDNISIEEEKLPGNVIYHVSVDQADMSRVIGRNGKVIKALRNICKVRAVKEDIRFTLNLIESF